MTIILIKVSIEEIYLNKKVFTHSQHNNQQWSAENFPAEIWAKIRMPTLTFLFNIESEVLATAIRQEKRKKSYPNWKGRGKIVITLW